MFSPLPPLRPPRPLRSKDRDLPEVDVNVIGDTFAGIIHLHKAPVFPLAGNSEGHFAGPFARGAVVDMADLGGDLTIEPELFRVDPRHHAIDLQKIGIPAAFLRAIQVKNTSPLANHGAAEIIPADPLERKKVAADEHLFGPGIINDRFLLAKDGYGRDKQRDKNNSERSLHNVLTNVETDFAIKQKGVRWGKDRTKIIRNRRK